MPLPPAAGNAERHRRPKLVVPVDHWVRAGSQPPTLALDRSPLPSDARRGAASHESEHENGGQQVGA